MLSYIVWNPDPVIISLGSFSLRWYSLLIALDFLACYYLAANMIKREDYSAKIQENGMIWFIGGLIVGARLGHCLFYEPGYYSTHPVDILKVWNGGLSSHGAVLGIIVFMGIYARRVKMPAFWFYDKLAVVFLFAGVIIRIANLINSESLGSPTGLPWGFVFVNLGEDFARHPSQLYEAIIYFLLFVCLFRYHALHWPSLRGGYLTGLSFTGAFAARFIIEFFKEEPIDSSILWGLNMGQILSIPLILLGVFLIWTKRGKEQGKSLGL